MSRKSQAGIPQNDAAGTLCIMHEFVAGPVLVVSSIMLSQSTSQDICQLDPVASFGKVNEAETASSSEFTESCLDPVSKPQQAVVGIHLWKQLKQPEALSFA